MHNNISYLMDILMQYVSQDKISDILQSPSFEMLVGSVVIKSTLLGMGLGVLYGVYSASRFLFLPSLKVSSTTVANTNTGSKGVPKHVAVIMDGNRRFGKKTHSDPLKGHWSGGQTLIDFVEWCIEDGVEILTVYAFSTENWSREDLEVNTLMVIISKYAKSFQKEALNKNVKVNILCTDQHQLPSHVKESIEDLETSTKDCDGFVFNICLSYGGRADIVQACQTAAKEVSSGAMEVAEITETYFASQLLTKDMPAPEMLIRTSGECRVSNFLLWQLAYSELFFVKKLWPEVTQEDLRILFSEFRQRTRRFGI
jgi:undecaprenyl diphosphate synthase